MLWNKRVLVLLCAVVTACGGPSLPVLTSSLYVGPSAMLVAYREVDSGWRTLTPMYANADGARYQVATHGNFVVTVVCDEQLQMTPGVTTSSWTTYQLGVIATADHLDGGANGADVTACLPPGPQHVLHGQVVQPGVVGYAGASTSSASPDWSFDLVVGNGSSLYAISGDKIALRPDVSVGADTVLTPAIDIDAEGVPLVDTAFSIANPGDGETLEAFIGVGESYELFPAQIYDGPPETAKVAPDAIFSADGGLPRGFQTVSLRANRDLSSTSSARRALRRLYRAGDDTRFTLPPPIAGLKWDASSTLYTARWSSLPDDHDLSVNIVGSSATGHLARHALYMDAEFVSASGFTSATIDTTVPGYKPEWRVDLSQPYSRMLTAQQVSTSQSSTGWTDWTAGTSTSWITESMNASGDASTRAGSVGALEVTQPSSPAAAP